MYPNFLIIGAQKAGTTWLDRNLREHPKIWLPPEKEIHFFDLPRPLPFAALLVAPVRAARNWSKARLKRDYVKVKAGEQSISWYVRYYFLPRTNGWYRSLFQPVAGQICGEASPPLRGAGRIENPRNPQAHTEAQTDLHSTGSNGSHVV